MPLQIKLDSDRADPLYRQIADQTAAAIAAGTLAPGERLPTVRELADRLGITRLTVHKGYRELQGRGLVEATVGRGTFVTERATAGATGGGTGRQGLTADAVMADIQKYGAEADMTNLAHAEPDPALIPAAAFWDCFEALRADAAAHLQYVSPQGDAGLREQLAQLVAGRGIDTRADEILVTSGVTQGLSLVSQALARPGERVAVEQPTYLGLLHILEAQGLRPVGVPVDDDGPRLDVLERICAHDRPRFFYTIATFHNPTGRSMSTARRRDLLRLAERHSLFVVEDDIYHHLAYDQPPPPTLKSLDRRGLVIYLDGMSKAILPGVRAGYLVAPPPLLDRLLSLRRAADLCGPLAIQRALAEFLRRGEMARQMKKVLPVYRRRRDALLAALGDAMPEGVTWTRPQGGFCCWLTLPGRAPFADLYWDALDRGIITAPGQVFQVDREEDFHLRLCFGNNPEKTIQAGVRVLGELIGEKRRAAPIRRRAAADSAPLV